MIFTFVRLISSPVRKVGAAGSLASPDFGLRAMCQASHSIYTAPSQDSIPTYWPSAAPTLWTQVTPDEWPDWVRPSGAHDAYNTGDKVTHNGKQYTSQIDGNTTEPGTDERWWSETKE